MKTSHYFLSIAVKISFVLFGIIPVISLILFGAIPIFPVAQSIINWAGADFILGATVFLSYLVIVAIHSVLKNRTYFSSPKIST